MYGPSKAATVAAACSGVSGIRPGDAASVPPASAAEAERIQEQLRRRLDLTGAPVAAPRLVAGLDVSYEKDSSRVAAAVLVDLATLDVRESVVVHGEAAFPCVPGLLAFREVPILMRT